MLRRCGHALRRLRLLGGMHGEFTFETKTGPRTIAFERGVIESVSGSNVVVQAKDGTTWTWVLESSTVIRQGGQKSATSALSDGEHVFAGGSVISGGYDAKLIVVKPGFRQFVNDPDAHPGHRFLADRHEAGHPCRAASGAHHPGCCRVGDDLRQRPPPALHGMHGRCPWQAASARE